MSQPPSESELTHIIDVWKQIIDVQKHFNDLSLRIRNFLITMSGGLIGAIIFLYDSGNQGAAEMVSWLGVLVVLATWIMDRWWYHKLLRGAVKAGEQIEDRFGGILDVPRLTQKISSVSPLRLSSRTGAKEISAGTRITIFYALLMLGFVISIVTTSIHEGKQPSNTADMVVQQNFGTYKTKESILELKHELSLVTRKLEELTELLTDSVSSPEEIDIPEEGQ